MVDPAQKPANSGFERQPKELVREAAAKLYGQGFRRPQIARALLEHLVPSRNLKAARGRLAKWENEKEFRDLIWKHSIQKLDMDTPHILDGIGKAAKRGRVDAAKLALTLTERYTDKSDMPQSVELRLVGVERPGRAAIRPEPERELPRASTTDEAS